MSMCSSKFAETLWRLAAGSSAPRAKRHQWSPSCPKPLDNGYLGKGSKIRASFFTPALQGFDELEGNSESFERKASDPKDLPLRPESP